MPSSPPPATAPPPARLTSAQLRELSQQWRQRVDEDPDKVHRVAAALEWLATQREGSARAQPQRVEPRPALLRHWLAMWREGLSRLHLAR